jgi:hypothetical protein
MQLWERNLRTLVANASRAGQPVCQVYRADVDDLLCELDRTRERVEHYKDAAVAALDTMPLMVMAAGKAIR